MPRITASQAFKEDGLLMVIFDEAAGGDSSSCCGELPGPAAPEPGGTGLGGGRTGAVLLSPCIAPRTVTDTAYNHYTMLGSVENIFGLSHLGYAGLPHSTYFGTDIYKRQCGPSPPAIETGGAGIAPIRGTNRLHMSIAWTVSTRGGTPLAYVAAPGARGQRLAADPRAQPAHALPLHRQSRSALHVPRARGQRRRPSQQVVDEHARSAPLSLDAGSHTGNARHRTAGLLSGP